MTEINGKGDPRYKRIKRKRRQKNQERFGTNKKALNLKKTKMEKEKLKKKREEENRRKKETDAVNLLKDKKIIKGIKEELAKEFCEKKGKIKKGHKITVDFYTLEFVAQITIIEVINRINKLKMVCKINGKEILIDLSNYIKVLKKMQDCNLKQDCLNC